MLSTAVLIYKVEQLGKSVSYSDECVNTEEFKSIFEVCDILIPAQHTLTLCHHENVRLQHKFFFLFFLLSILYL